VHALLNNTHTTEMSGAELRLKAELALICRAVDGGALISPPHDLLIGLVLSPC
jgi:hypothetical protein